MKKRELLSEALFGFGKKDLRENLNYIFDQEGVNIGRINDDTFSKVSNSIVALHGIIRLRHDIKPAEITIKTWRI